MAVHCARIDEETTEKAITRIIQKLGYSQLKPEQLKVIMEFVCGKLKMYLPFCLLALGKHFAMLAYLWFLMS